MNFGIQTLQGEAGVTGAEGAGEGEILTFPRATLRLPQCLREAMWALDGLHE